MDFENLGKILENPGKNGTQRCFLKKRRQKHMWRPLLEITPKKVLIFVGDNL